jgi:hypothetical protein
MVWIKQKSGKGNAYRCHLVGTKDEYQLLGFDNHYYLINLADVELNLVIRPKELVITVDIAKDL